jgi:5-methyltetrahydropteroyltriglutamate--homocysteine methyltransferase
VTLQQNTDRIQTTHIGSLPRPHDLLDLLKAKFAGQPVDQATLDKTIAAAVTTCIRKQVECGLDIVTDGEFSKPGFFTYIQERLEGYEARPGQKLLLFQKETAAFPEYYAQYFKEAMMGGTIVPIVPVVCTGPRSPWRSTRNTTRSSMPASCCRSTIRSCPTSSWSPPSIRRR